MADLYLKTSYAVSKLITKNYSTSFSMGCLLFAPKVRQPIYGIYGFVRVADEIVDTFKSADQREIFDEFEIETWQAINRKISSNPVLQAFQQVYHQYNFSPDLVTAFLDSMRIDLSEKTHCSESLEQYVYGSAEVVGLMCLQVFTSGKIKEFPELTDRAQELGRAFQLLNFLRDLAHDTSSLERTYFAEFTPGHFSADRKKQIEQTIETQLLSAKDGILCLPISSRVGVYLAFRLFYQLLNQIKAYEPQSLFEQRVRVNAGRKLLVLLTTPAYLLIESRWGDSRLMATLNRFFV